MARTYAGLLGILAFTTAVIRNVVHQGNLEGSIKMALASLFAWAMLGYAAGWIAERTIVQSVYRSFRSQLADRQLGDSVK